MTRVQALRCEDAVAMFECLRAHGLTLLPGRSLALTEAFVAEDPEQAERALAAWYWRWAPGYRPQVEEVAS